MSTPYVDRSGMRVIPKAVDRGGVKADDLITESGIVTFTTTATQATVKTKLNVIEGGFAIIWNTDISSITTGTSFTACVLKAVTESTTSHLKTFVINRSSTGAVSGGTFYYEVRGRTFSTDA